MSFLQRCTSTIETETEIIFNNIGGIRWPLLIHLQSIQLSNLVIMCAFNHCVYHINPMYWRKYFSIIELVKICCYFVSIGRRWNSGLTSLFWVGAVWLHSIALYYTLYSSRHPDKQPHGLKTKRKGQVLFA